MQQSGENASPLSSTDKIFFTCAARARCRITQSAERLHTTLFQSLRCSAAKERRIAARQQLPRHCLPLPPFRRAPRACYSVRRSGRDRDLWALDLFDNP